MRCRSKISRPRASGFLAGMGLLGFLVQGCSTTLWRAKFVRPKEFQSFNMNEPFLKCHLYSGEVYVLDKWKLDQEKQVLGGSGLLYTTERDLKERGIFDIPLEKIALVETNQPEKVSTTGGAVAVMGVITGVSLAVTIACAANPKSCFGSCPTFYAFDGEQLSLQAEGFSNAVARVLESIDVDALSTARAQDGVLELLMTNEALETHFVKQVRLLAVPKDTGEQVFRSGDLFYPASRLLEPVECKSETGDCLDLVRVADDLEYQSPADGQDLASREDMVLRFPPTTGSLGLVIRARNSLMNTFLFYQALAYMGRSAGEWFMKLERGGPEALGLFEDLGREIEGIHVSVLTKNGWKLVGTHVEIGPIAKEVVLVTLPRDLPPGEIQVRLNLTRGYWKLDTLALAVLEKSEKSLPVEVGAVLRDGRPDPEAWNRLRDPNAYLVTFPGDAYALRFDLPPGEHAFFLETQGFYYEWIRKDWLPEEDPDALAQMLLDPPAAYRRLAPAYKRIEASMDEIFWQSRIGR